MWAVYSTVGSASVLPPIAAIENNYGYRYFQPVLQTYGIARGSIFAVYGFFSAESTVSQDPPLQRSLAGVTIEVTVGGVTTQAIPYFVSSSEIIAILPSETPVGTGTITVTSGGLTASAPIHVVESAFGLMATDDLPVENAVAQNDSEGGETLRATNAANPGERITLFGSGLGPVSGDETQYQVPTDLTNIPAQVDVGGVSATVTFHGRTVYPGLDQIQVIVPAGVSGCNVSVVVTAGGLPSNFAKIPVAPSGRICSDDPVLAPVTMDERENLASLANVDIGSISLTNVTPVAVPSLAPPPGWPPPPDISIPPPVTEIPPARAATSAPSADSAYATFQKYTAQGYASSGFLQQASMGSCLILNGVPLTGWTSFTPLDAGPQIDINGPFGSVALTAPRFYDQFYAEHASTLPPIIPPAGGNFTFENGSGGSWVGPFTASVSEDFKPPLMWTNREEIRTVQRDRGQLITWAGGVDGSFVEISGYSFADEPSPARNGANSYMYFTCSAPVSAGRFMVPSAVLESLPSASGYLYVTNKKIQRFSAPGLDLGFITMGVGSGISVPFESETSHGTSAGLR